MSKNRSNTKPAFLSLVFILIFQQFLGALTFPVAKFGLSQIEPFTFAFFRFILSSVVLLSITKFMKHDRKIEKNDYKKIMLLGFLIIPLNQTLYLWGQSLTGVGHGSVLFATTPIWIFIAATIHFKHKIYWRQLAGILIAITGVLTIVSEGIKVGSEYIFGDLLIMVCVVAWAYYTILGKPLVEKYGAIRITAYAIAFGSALYFPFGIYRALIFDFSSVDITRWWTVVYVAIGTSVICYILWYWVLKFLDAARIAVYHNLQPIMATIIAFIWLDEKIGSTFIIGSLIAITGVLLAEINPPKQVAN